MAVSSVSSEALARLLAAGPLALDDREALQLAAGLTAGQTEAIFEEFGSLPESLGAGLADLRRCLPPRPAARVVLLRDVARRLAVQPLKRRSVLSGWQATADYLRIVLKGLPREQLRGLFLDGRDRLIRDEALSDGTVDAAPAYPREILRRALELNASAIVLAHNHPAGDPEPSAADIATTREVADAGRALCIPLRDHFLVAGESLTSFRRLGLL